MALWLLVGSPVALATWTQPVGTLTDLGELLPDGKTVLLTPELWKGRVFPLVEYIDVGKRLSTGDWIVILYHYDCPRCRETISGLSRTAGIESCAAPLSVALVEMPPYASRTPIALPSGIASLSGRLTNVKDWLAETPVAVLLRDGEVIDARAGEAALQSVISSRLATWNKSA